MSGVCGVGLAQRCSAPWSGARECSSTGYPPARLGGLLGLLSFSSLVSSPQSCWERRVRGPRGPRYTTTTTTASSGPALPRPPRPLLPLPPARALALAWHSAAAAPCPLRLPVPPRSRTPPCPPLLLPPARALALAWRHAAANPLPSAAARVTSPRSARQLAQQLCAVLRQQPAAPPARQRHLCPQQRHGLRLLAQLCPAPCPRRCCSQHPAPRHLQPLTLHAV